MIARFWQKLLHFKYVFFSPFYIENNVLINMFGFLCARIIVKLEILLTTLGFTFYCQRTF